MPKIHYQATFSAEEKRFVREDGGAALIFHEEPIEETGPGNDQCFHVRLHSYDETFKHAGVKQLFGKRVRVTIEIMD
jgi:hypothetical protein